MGNVHQALKMQHDAQRRRALAPEYDSVRRDFDLVLADEMEREAQDLLTPQRQLQTGLGGEFVPPVEHDLPGLESVLKEPDLLNLGASIQRSDLIERAGVLELGIETAQDTGASRQVHRLTTQRLRLYAELLGVPFRIDAGFKRL